MAEEKKTRTRAKRRNYQRELETLRQFVAVKIDVLNSIDKSGEDPLWRSSIEAYAEVLTKIDGGAA